MYANAAIMNPIRFLCIQKYAKLPVSNLTIRGEKRTSALEMSPPPLLLELLCRGPGDQYTAKLSASAKSWLLLLPPGKGAVAKGTPRLPLPTLSGCSGFRGTVGQSQQRNRPAERDHLLYIFRSSHSLLLQNQRTAQVGRNLERSSSPTFCGKGCLLSSTLRSAHLITSSDGDSTTSLGMLFQ